MRKDILLTSTRGENDLMKFLPFLTDVVMGTFDDRQWCVATPEYGFNPFGKLLKSPATYHAKGHILEHKKYYHGFFASLNCTEDFYNKHKKNLDKYTVEAEQVIRDFQPTWL